LSSEKRLQLVRVLALAAGGFGMVSGQALDMYWTSKGGYKVQDLEAIHSGKTGALIGACCAMGAISAGADKADVEVWLNFGKLIGIAFQAIDDTIDKSSGTGKTVGKDAAQGKLTYLSLFSAAETEKMALDLTEEAITKIPAKCDKLKLDQFVRDLVFRKK
jgi:geranylgeranyl pyrophosphate synthase